MAEVGLLPLGSCSFNANTYFGGYAQPPVSHTDARQNARLEPCLFRPDRTLAGANPQASGTNPRKPPPALCRSAGRTPIFRSSLPGLIPKRYFSGVLFRD